MTECHCHLVGLKTEKLAQFNGKSGAEIRPVPQDGISFEEEVLLSVLLFNCQATTL